MGKGSSPSGSTTSSTVNPTAAAQLPYLQDVWGKAQSLYNQQPGITPALTQAYQNYANTGTSIDQNLRPVTNATYNTALTGGYGVQNSPAYPYLTPLAAGTTTPQTNLATYGAQAASPTGPGYDQLAASARGDYLNKNPYIADAVQAALDPVGRTYQTVTDPTTRYNFSTAGRYGSPALEGAGGVRSTNELNLAKSLGDISSGMYSADYAKERGLQDTAAQGYVTGQNYGLGLGIDAANKNLTGQEYGAGGLQTGYQAGNTAALTGLGYTPSVTDANLAGSKANIAAGTGLLSSQYAPLQDYSGLAGQPTTGSSSTTSPYFQNATANTLSALTGAGSLANSLGGSSLFGSGAGGIGAFGPELSGGAAESLLAAPGAAFLDASGGTGLATLASAAPAAGFWIVCTELKRQGRMPAKHWAVGIALFAGYPERTKRGYYLWAIPTVRHLRAYPDSRFSRFICAISCWRAENIAARRGVRGARWRFRGAVVTGIGYPLCATLGYFVSPQDWSAVYREEAAR